MVNALVLGAAWGIAAIVLYPAAAAQGQTVTAVITGGMIYGGGFALSAIPAAMNAYLAPLALGAVAALALNWQPTDLVLGIPLVVFTFIIQRAGAGHGRLLRANFEDRESIAEQSNVIRLLLREFEEGTSDWLWQVDAHGRLQRGAERTAEATGIPLDCLLECDFRNLTVRCCDDPACQAPLLQRHLEDATPFRDIEVRFPHAQDPRWLRLSGHPLRDATGQLIGFRGVGSDVSAKKAAEQHIEYLARHDALTGLLNRSSFGEKLARSLAERMVSGKETCLLYLALDGFKGVNDRRGHGSGDRLLVDIARRIAQVTGPDGIAARLGGDEFAVLMPESERAVALDLSSRLIQVIGEPLELDGDLLSVGVSIGVAFSGPDTDTAEALLRAADTALYRAKEGSKNTSRVFDAEMRAAARKQRELQQGLHFAVERNEMQLRYQPIVEAGSGTVLGFEALLRWRHPLRGMLGPSEFLHLAEAGGTIHEIGRWTVREACRTAATWPPHIFVSINLSPEQFHSPDLLTDIDSAIRVSGLDPRRIEAEIAERALMTDEAAAAHTLSGLEGLGLSVALDDFGTGCSSLSCLTAFGLGRLKIDRSLVAQCDTDDRARSVLEAIMAICAALGVQTTAEGVENDRHVSVLRDSGCRRLQGYLFSRPLPPDQLLDMFRTNRRRRVPC